MKKTTAQRNSEIANKLSNNLSRLLYEFYKDQDRRILQGLIEHGHPEIRPAHTALFSNLGMGAVRVTELAQRANVTQQAMGKMLKELERLGYIARDIDAVDKRAKEIRVTELGKQLAKDIVSVGSAVREYYNDKIGAQELTDLESRLRSAVDKLELDYLPESWAG